MNLVIEKTNDAQETFDECFKHLESRLSGYYLLTKDEREECVDAVHVLQRVFSRFGRKSSAGQGVCDGG